MVAILVMWPGPFEQTFVPTSQAGSIWNFASIGPVVSEEKMFENVDIYIHTTEAYLYYGLTNEHKGTGELKIAYLPTHNLNSESGDSKQIIF